MHSPHYLFFPVCLQLSNKVSYNPFDGTIVGLLLLVLVSSAAEEKEEATTRTAAAKAKAKHGEEACGYNKSLLLDQAVKLCSSSSILASDYVLVLVDVLPLLIMIMIYDYDSGDGDIG
ncbi:hypothetical protein RIF29_07491 [Crotalaria pallida]|uniref:Uncharacterized protein n=1 Tax=Crotalaria pallida TaxID=3830 RepID=A0AAN9J461_CROPI